MVLDQAPPSNTEAESTVIASLIIDSEAVSRVAAFLHTQDFFQRRHSHMYDAALALWDRGENVNQITLAHELARRGQLEDSGGHAYIAQIVADLPTSVGVEYSAKIVQRDATYRRLIEASGVIARIGYEAGPNLPESLGRAESLLMALRGGERLRDFVSLRDLLESFLGPPSDEDEKRLTDVARSGFADLDTLLTGFKRSDLIVLAARPSVGKSALALSMARNLALGQGGRVAFFSLEMSAEQLAGRLISTEAEVESQRLPWGRHTEVEEGRISRAIGNLSRAEIYIDETPGVTVAELRAKARRLANDVGVDLIIVDHMQLMHGSAGTGMDTNRVAEMSFISRSLKELAREIETPVLALSQLSRAVEARQSHIPYLSDLRESGSIEQDADVVLFIYREDMYVDQNEFEDLHPEDPESYPRGLAQIIVAKHRNGPTGTVNFRFRRNIAKFEDLIIRTESEEGDGQTPMPPLLNLPGDSSSNDAEWNLEHYDE